jgi:tetratricopeptide (TPR) repeat protein
VVALGLLADVATSSDEKLQHARIIKQEAEFLIQLDSLYAPSFFILGKWNLSLAQLSWIEKLACNVLFGGVPKGASLKNAIDCFDRAIALQPDCILFHYNRALAYYYLGNFPEARGSLNRAFALPQREPDDRIRLQQCTALLKETNKQTAK